MKREALESRLRGALLGVAVGDALGLPAEGMSASAIRGRFGRLERFRLLGGTGFVSDDTQLTALLLQSWLRGGADDRAVERHFRRALLGWLARLPWGIGLATLRACLRIALGLRRSGIDSAGNGSSMRAGALGVALAHEPERRRTLSSRLARVTHTHPAAVDGALFTAELAARLALGEAPHPAFEASLELVRAPELASALARAQALAGASASFEQAAAELGTTGYVVHTLGLAGFSLLRQDAPPLEALIQCLEAGGDTDTRGAILGGWLGAMHGEAAFPESLLGRLQRGPFGRAHLEALALAASRGLPAPRYGAAAALLLNLALYPVILAHGLRRLLP